MLARCRAMTRPSTVRILAFALFTFMTIGSARAEDAGVCATVPARYRDRAVIVFQPPSSFIICRGGSAQEDVIAGRPVYLMLSATQHSSTFDFSVHGRAAEPGPSGLGAVHEKAVNVANQLAALADSGATIADMDIPPAPTATRPLVAARMLYLGYVTPRFHATLDAIGSDADTLLKIAGIVSRWCDEAPEQDRPQSRLAERLRTRCADESAREPVVVRAVAAFDHARHRFRALQETARQTLIDSDVDPTNATAATAAIRALDAARAAAMDLLADARTLVPIAKALAGDAVLLRRIVHAAGVLRPREVVYLATYSHAGNAILELDVHPLAVTIAGIDSGQESGTITHRFAVVDTHYIDVEFGVGVTGGVPPVPNLATANGMTVVQGRPLDEFVALALLELEPLRFFDVDKSWAGLLRLPVLAVPLSRDPTQNFFIGAGIGWTGVGSITAGPYFVRETTLNAGIVEGQPLPVGSSLTGVTHTQLQTGYFISASIDLVGVFHLIVPRHLRTFDAATGAEK